MGINKGKDMKEISVNVFYNIDEAVIWIENEITELAFKGYDDIKAELVLIDGAWRCGVITDTRQIEFDYD